MFSCSEFRETLAGNQTAIELPFVLSSGKEHLRASGIHAVLDTKDLSGAPSAAHEFLARSRRDDAPAMLVGALPFRNDQQPYLVQPKEAVQDSGSYRWDCSVDCKNLNATTPWTAVTDPSPEIYERMVTQALERMRENTRLRKVVLGRRLIIATPGPMQTRDVLCRLASDRNATTFVVPLPTLHGEKRYLIGATPELLLEKRGNSVLSIPLAGSAPRSTDPEEDQAAGEGLLHSDKNLREHALTVESVTDRLAPLCGTLRCSSEPFLVGTATMWHLATRVEGQAGKGISSLDLAVALHPTAAVCGMPHDLAAETISELEPFDRDYFAGAVGWCDAAGDGRWMVTIRCGEIQGNRATLFAGAGILPGSDPHAEEIETSAKFRTMLRALAIDETNGVPGDPK